MTFNHIALASFGGGLSAWSREVLVVEKKWMGEEEFLSRDDDVPDPARRQPGQHGRVRRHEDAGGAGAVAALSASAWCRC